MERRTFVKTLAASLSTAGVLAEIARAFADQLENLQTDIQTLSTEQALWKRVRQEFILNPGLVHLNCGSVGATPRMVIDAVSAYMRQFEGDPVHHSFGSRDEVATKAADFLNAAADEIAVTRNTTEGMNMIAEGLDLQPGDQILTSNHEHGGGMICWQHLAQRRGIEVVYLPLPDPVESKEQILQLVKDHLSDRTRVCSFMHIDTITGLCMPLADIAAITRPRDILLVADGAQGPGMLDVDVRALGVDTYASSSHKWMLAPKGSGLLYVRRDVQDRIRPVDLYSGYGQPGYSASGGTRNAPIVLGHGLAMDFHNAIGRGRIEQRCRQLSDRMRQRLGQLPQLRLLTPQRAELSSGIVSFALEKGSSSEIADRLYKEHDIVVKVPQGTYAFVPEKEVPRKSYNGLRFSTHIFNSEDDVDRTVDLIGAMLRT